MRVGDRFDLCEESIHGQIIWINEDELRGEVLGIAVAMDCGSFAAVDLSKLPAPVETMQ